MITVAESGVVFGPFEEDNFFPVEKSRWLSRLEGIKACELVYWKPQKGKLYFIEAKSSIPSHRNSPSEYEAYFVELFEKFDNSLQLLVSGILGRPKELASELGSGVSSLDWEQAQICFYLVIPKVPDQYLPDLTEKLRKALSRQRKVWNATVFVINERLAFREGLLTQESTT